MLPGLLSRRRGNHGMARAALVQEPLLLPLSSVMGAWRASGEREALLERSTRAAVAMEGGKGVEPGDTRPGKWVRRRRKA